MNRRNMAPLHSGYAKVALIFQALLAKEFFKAEFKLLPEQSPEQTVQNILVNLEKQL